MNRPKRIAVLIDWQNVYRTSRVAFGLEQSNLTRGVIDPVLLAREFSHRRVVDSNRVVELIEVHRGLPHAEKDPVGHRAVRRQAASWVKNAKQFGINLRARLRLLHYSRAASAGTRRPVEKGIDVQLAISAVVHAMSDDIDVVVIFSHDSDLLPAVEAIVSLRGPEHVETASWRSESFRSRIRPVPGVFHHYLGLGDFARVETPVDFARRK